MPKIHVLPDRVANQIAAGEVVERPAAVIKELIENSLDAGATRIEVEFRQGGRELLRVEDNGCGMSREDALLALERHATSKIAETADLDRLATFGFRGEALPSIASVSRFTLQTRAEKAEAGTEILVDGGRQVHARDCGRPVGTSVEAARLFHSVPARRKFLKTDATEAAHIAQCVRLYALACPRVAFTLIGDGRVAFRSPQCATLAERVGEIFGSQLAERLLPIEAAEPGLRLGGLIGRPGEGRSTRHELLTFVNGRPVDSRALNFALLESYRDSLPEGRYPRAILFFECDPAEVDVNIHPAKREVRFRREHQVREFVIRCVLGRLRELGTGAGVGAAEGPPGLGEPAAVYGLPASGPVSAGPAPPVSVSGGGRPAAAPEGAAARDDRVRNWRFLGIAHDLYAVFETPSGLVLLDRRAAHERIWFERLRGQFAAGPAPGQRLLLPVPLEVEPIAAAMLLDSRPFIEAHGFEIAEFGANFFRIEAAPQWMEPADAEPFLRDVLGELRDGKLALGNLDLARDELARLAAARAVRLPPAGGAPEMEALAARLFATGSPLTSPAGRPTFIEIDRAELAKRFQRP
ncbi:MAG: DNA mismatch repair endonuclease MutL [Opitutaceae bacterium]|jgi:DNA mismatch repair protein MutL